MSCHWDKQAKAFSSSQNSKRPEVRYVVAAILGVCLQLHGAVAHAQVAPTRPSPDRDDRQLPRPDLAIQLGHATLVNAVAVSQSGRWIASGGADGTIKIWDRTSGRLSRSLYGHRGWISGLAFIRQDQQLVSGGWDGSIRFWDVPSGTQLNSIDRLGEIRKIAVDPTDHWLVAVGTTGHVWDIAQAPKMIWEFTEDGLLTSVSFHPTLPEIVVGGWDSRVRVLDLVRKTEVLNFEADRLIFGVSFSADGQYIASAGHEVAVWNLKSHRKYSPPKPLAFGWT
jgi:WD40 repeat protein